MRSALRILAIVAVFGLTSIAWLVLGGVMSNRSNVIDEACRYPEDNWLRPSSAAE